MASATFRISAQSPVHKPQTSAASNAANTPAAEEPSAFSQIMSDVAAAKPGQADARGSKNSGKKDDGGASTPVPGKRADTVEKNNDTASVKPPRDASEPPAPIPQTFVPPLNQDLAAQDVPAVPAIRPADKTSPQSETDSDALPATPDTLPDMSADLALMMPVQAAPPPTSAPALPPDGETDDGVDESTPVAASAPSQTPDMRAAGTPDTAPKADAPHDNTKQADGALAAQDAIKPDAVQQAELPTVAIEQAAVAQPAVKQVAAPKSASAQPAVDDTRKADAITAPPPEKPLPPKPAAKTATANMDATNVTAAPHGRPAEAKSDTTGEAPRAPQSEVAPLAPLPAPLQTANNQPGVPLVAPLTVTITDPATPAIKGGGADKAMAADAPAPNMDLLAVQIAARSQSGARQFDIRLDPPELGRVDVRLSIDSTGKAQAHLTADQPQTLELLQKDATTLTRALRDAGLDVSQNGLNFSLRGQNSGNADTGMGGRSGRRTGIPVDTLKRLDPGNLAAAQWRGPADGRLDIRV